VDEFEEFFTFKQVPFHKVRKENQNLAEIKEMDFKREFSTKIFASRILYA